MSTWYGVEDDAAEERLVAAWPDAPTANLETCGYILTIAAGQVWEYAPESEDDDGEPVVIPDPPAEVDDRLVYAQLKQASALWDAGRVSSDGSVGVDSYVYTPRPLDKTIRGIIRPIKGAFTVA